MNNSGKTSFLRALHLALGADRRLIQPEDLFIDSNGQVAGEILIDVRIVPVGDDGTRRKQFPEPWIESDFGGGSLISSDSSENEFIAIRTRISRDVVQSDFSLDRLRLQEWPAFEAWHLAPTGSRAPRFRQLLSFFIDAQRDVVADLRSRASFFGRLLSKIEIPEAAIAELEDRLRVLNEDIVENSQVLTHIRDALAQLNSTVHSNGEGVEITPVSKKLRDLTKGLGVQFSDSAGSSFPLESHGMGTRSWASLLSFQAYVSWTARLSDAGGLPFHPVLFLEEPEAHLHPNAQRVVHAQLAQSGGQHIVSTHSPYIAGQAELGELLHFSKCGTETTIRRLPVEQLQPEDIRRIRREVMRSRGELLFSQAVVLFEGETEEQALPMFARHQWAKHPFERGVSFVGVGGAGNYFPFISLFEAFGIAWFIFSDGEPNARRDVLTALQRASLSEADSRALFLPDGTDIEAYLVSQGYQAELRTAVIELMRPTFRNEQHTAAKTRAVSGWSDACLSAYLANNKTAASPCWARSIIGAGGNRSVPTAIRELLDAVDRSLGALRSPVESAT